MRAVLVALLLALALFVLLGQLRNRSVTPAPTPAATPTNGRAAASAPPRATSALTEITVSELAARIARPVGRPSIVILYGAHCPISKRVFPELSTIAQRYGPQGIDFQAYSTDLDTDAQDVAPFLEMNHAPFQAVRVKEWPSGDLDRALTPLGIQVGDTWTRPLVVIRDATGHIVAQGQGVGDLTSLEEALASGALQSSPN